MIAKLLGKLVFGYKSTSSSYVKYLKKKGVCVGDSIEIFFPRDTFIDVLNPHLLKIGSYVSMTGPVTILTHDYSVCVLKKKYKGEILGKQCNTIIGNNVFLGWGCTVLPGACIEDNVIVGANAVVSGVLEHDSVYAGNPARRICSLEEYYNKRKKVQIYEATKIYKLYKERFGTTPPKSIFHEYFFLFSGGDFNMLLPQFKNKFMDHGNEEESKIYFKKHIPIFDNYEMFVDCIESGKLIDKK